MKVLSRILVILGAISLVSCEVFFEEKFDDGKRSTYLRGLNAGFI